MGPFLRLFQWIGRHERGMLVLLALFATATWGSIEIVDDVLEEETHVYDEIILQSLRTDDPSDPIGPPWFEGAVRDVTAMGSVTILTLLSLITTGFLLLEGKQRAAAFLAGAILGGLLLTFFLKNVFDRPRPELVPHETWVATASFPSGHSTMAAVTYLTLGALVARTHPRLRVKAYALLLALLLAVLVGASRVYLGVHWPSDVLAGWAIGSAWALLTWIVAAWLQRRGGIEPAG